MIVYKFGGATTRSIRGLERMTEIVRRTYEEQSHSRSRRGLVVVVSAIGHTTRRLRSIAEDAEAGKAIIAGETLERIIERHEQLAESLELSERAYSAAVTTFRKLAAEIAKLVEGVTITRELSNRTLDAFLSKGEYFATALIGALFADNDIPVKLVDARDIVITDANYSSAAPDLEAIRIRTTERVLPILNDGRVVLTQGFVAGTKDRDTTTMGSESSDLTATLLGRALEAKEVVIWKTVSGIYTADPEYVPHAQPIRNLSFDEADELGRRGVRALFQNVARPLLSEDARHKTIVRVTSPEVKSARGTVIAASNGTVVRTPKPVALALEENIATVYVKPVSNTEASKKKRSREAQLAYNKTQGIPAFALNRAFYYWASDTEITISFRRDERRTLFRALKDAGYELQEEKPLAALSMLVRTRDATQDLTSIRERLFRSLRSFPVRAVFPVESSFVVLLDEDRGVEALKKVHKDFFE
jgi:aspartate kinase